MKENSYNGKLHFATIYLLKISFKIKFNFNKKTCTPKIHRINSTTFYRVSQQIEYNTKSLINIYVELSRRRLIAQ